MKSLTLLLVFVVIVLLFTGRNLIFGKKRTGTPCPSSLPIGLVTLKAEKNEVGFELIGENSALVPMTMRLDFSDLKNLKPSENMPYTVALPARQRGLWIVDLSVIDALKASNFRYKMELTHGDCFEAKHDDNCMYLLPFEHGTKHIVVQGYGGSFSHMEPFTKYAVDFGMDEGTMICAARGGLVFAVKEDSKKGGNFKHAAKNGNYIRIFHSDGTMATYDHLKQNGADVEIGDKVEAGQVIGSSGNTGYSKGPHLHFAVYVANKMAKEESIPTEFRTIHGRTKLEVGKSYYSTHPGGEPFEDLLGSDITNEYYQYYSKEVEKNDKATIRQEVHDRTVVFFMTNGFDRALDVEFMFDELENMETSKECPLKIVIPRKTEKFLLFARAKSLDKYAYKTKFKYKYAD